MDPVDASASSVSDLMGMQVDHAEVASASSMQNARAALDHSGSVIAAASPAAVAAEQLQRWERDLRTLVGLLRLDGRLFHDVFSAHSSSLYALLSVAPALPSAGLQRTISDCVSLMLGLSDGQRHRLMQRVCGHTAMVTTPSSDLSALADDLLDQAVWTNALYAPLCRMPAQQPLRESSDVSAHVSSSTDNELKGHMVQLGGIWLPRKRGSHSFQDDQNANIRHASPAELVSVASTQTHLRSIALAICEGVPVLLEGPNGCGKSALLNYVASQTGNEDMIRIHLVKLFVRLPALEDWHVIVDHGVTMLWLRTIKSTPRRCWALTRARMCQANSSSSLERCRKRWWKVKEGCIII